MKPAAIVGLVFILLIPIAAVIATQSSSKDTSVNPTPTPSPSASAVSVPADAISAEKVILKTDKGDITLNLYPKDAPLTVQNFVTLGKRGYYNGIIFHRVLKDFVIQAGDPTGTGKGGESIYGPTFKDEINSHKIVVGTLAMANAGANTNGSQFFIVTEQDQPSLDGSYTVFGQVADDASMQVVKAIAAVPVNNDTDGKPLTDVKITGFEIVQ